MRLFIIAAVIFITGCSQTSDLARQSDESVHEKLYQFKNVITDSLLYQHLSVIAHDSLEGRDTGMPGQKKAAEYLASQHRSMGLKPMGDNDTYFQNFTLNANRTDSLVYKLYSTFSNDTLLVDSYTAAAAQNSPFIKLFGGSVPLSGDIIFAGFGVDDFSRNVNHLGDKNLAGSWILIFEDIPYIIEGDTLVNPAITGNSRFGTILGQKGADGVLLIGTETRQAFQKLSEIDAQLLSKPTGMSLPYLQRSPAGQFPKGIIKLDPTLAATILGFEFIEELYAYYDKITANIRDFEPFKLDYTLDYTPYNRSVEVDTENVIALFEGGDPELKEEVIVLTAHYDHLGITFPDETGDMINNGADDDGSGTVALLAIAQALQNAAGNGYRPDRSVLFLHVTAEEKGLLGSRYYSDHPVVPIENTVANFNADMIGRSTPDRRESGNTDYVFVIGGEIISSTLDSLVQVANRSSVNMNLDPKYNDLADPNQFYRRSDHWNFGRLGVPFVFFFTGVHEDYHRPSDTIDKIDFPKLTRVTRLIYTSVIETANHSKRPVVDSEEFIRITQ
ncbi:MAG: M28 family peptidase [Balneolaceae bacterium]